VFADSEAVKGTLKQRYDETTWNDDGHELQSFDFRRRVVSEDGADQTAEPMTGSLIPLLGEMPF